MLCHFYYSILCEVSQVPCLPWSSLHGDFAPFERLDSLSNTKFYSHKVKFVDHITLKLVFEF